MTKMRKPTSLNVVCIIAIFVIVFIGHGALAAELAIIANPNLDIDTLSPENLADIYQTNKTKWDSGERIVVVMLKTGPTHDSFLEKFIGLSPSKFRTLWKKAIFTGSGSLPKIVFDEDKMVKIISEVEGAIGYINASTPHPGVKIVSVIDK